MIFLLTKPTSNINMVSKLSMFLLPLLVLFFIVQPFLVHSRTLMPKNKYFQNFRESTQKGKTISSLIEVKQYLHRFGYYVSDDFEELTDEFDENLKFALETYQNNFHLNVTGTLDSDTMKKMMVPRCGVPDMVNYNTSSKHFHSSGKFHMVSHYSFLGNGKWRSNDLTYGLQKGRQGLEEQAVKNIISRAFKRWSEVTNLKFQEAPQGKEANIKISFESRQHGDGYPFDGQGRVSAHAFAPTIGLLHFDADENWSTTDPSKDQIDLESIAVHEIGHTLGLGHSDDQSAVMYPYLNYGNVKRNLTKDDIDGIKSRYGLN